MASDASNPEDVRRWKMRLESAVEVLSADAEAQIEWLDAFFTGEPSVVVDELALHLDDSWMGGRIMYADAVSPHTRAHVDSLDRALEEISGQENADLWTPDALRLGPEWAAIRELARAALDALRNDLIRNTDG